ncbi:MAG: hypothetical protein HY048_00135 [Acidobacteria bacterium]|nr:hypothetical protein [Acidobacteriota bacterium]
MRVIASLVLVGLLAAPAIYAQQSQTYAGVITDTMCTTNHKPMNVSPDEKCVRECVGDAKTHKYALAVGKGVYTLSDQETPASFAGQKVKVTGVLFTKTNILKVDRIVAAH